MALAPGARIIASSNRASSTIYALVVQRIGPLASTQKMSVRFAPRVPLFILSPVSVVVSTPCFQLGGRSSILLLGTTLSSLRLNSSKSSKERAPALIKPEVVT
jgi:hypothetical protein